jgi:hypothetical protein
VVFAAVAGELLPEVMKAHNVLGVILGFTLGVLAMLGLRRFSERRAAHTKPGAAAAGSFVLTVGADVLIDGLLLGVSFAAGERVGDKTRFQNFTPLGTWLTIVPVEGVGFREGKTSCLSAFLPVPNEPTFNWDSAVSPSQI